MSKPYPPFFRDCVGWPSDQIDALHLLIDEADDISLEEFTRLIGDEQLEELAEGLGYATSDEAEGIRLEGDYHVGYRLHAASGVPFMVHSAIEMVFATEEDIERLQRRAEAQLDGPSC